jgi:hypothetical protein
MTAASWVFLVVGAVVRLLKLEALELEMLKLTAFDRVGVDVILTHKY